MWFRRSLFLFTAGFFACQTSKNDLVIYTSADQEQAQAIVNTYKQVSGETVKFVRLSTGEGLTRIRTEAKNPRAGAWLIGPATDYAVGASEGLFESYEPKAPYKIKPEYHDSKWRWTGIALGVIGFAVNKNFLKSKKIEAPKSWNDLLKPEFRGQIGYALPYTSGTALTILTGLIQMMGEEKAFNYFKALNTQVHQYTKSGSASVTQVGLGELAIGIVFSHDVISRGIQKGYPIQLSLPKDGSPMEITSLALLKNGTTPEKAKAFIDWMHGEAAQKVLEAWHMTPLNPNVKVRPPTVPAQSVRLAMMDLDQGVQNKEKFVSRWRAVTGK